MLFMFAIVHQIISNIYMEGKSSQILAKINVFILINSYKFLQRLS